MERTQENLDRLTNCVADAAVMAFDLGLDELARALADLATHSAAVAAIEPGTGNS